MKKNLTLFRPALVRIIPTGWLIIGILYFVHAAIRFGGLWNPLFYPLSMVILWPLPWLLSPREGRDAMGFGKPVSGYWFSTGPLAALLVLVLSVLVAKLLFGAGDSNWLHSHARYLHESVSGLPPDAATYIRFMAATLPAMLFSPIAEEFLYRGFMFADLSMRWGKPAAMVTQASAFALLHLAHYGVNPFQPALIAVFLPSIFAAGLTFGWIRHKSGSIWVTVWSHSLFNLGMNGVVFLWY